MKNTKVVSFGKLCNILGMLNESTIKFTSCRNNSPDALELKCIEVWLISCTLFVFFALIEYFVVLFGIRYDKHWRHKKRDLERVHNNAAPAASDSQNNVTNNLLTNNHIPNPSTTPIRHMNQLPPLLTRRSGASSSRVDNLRLFGISKVAPQDGEAVKERVSPSNVIRVRKYIFINLWPFPRYVSATIHYLHILQNCKIFFSTSFWFSRPTKQGNLYISKEYGNENIICQIFVISHILVFQV